MSFNTHDINPSPLINRNNYEEYFLLYVDDELTAAEKSAVEDFVAANPDLKAELEILLSTKLPAEKVEANKEELSAEHMQLNEINEALLLYLDNELSEKDKQTLEQTLHTDKNYLLQYQLLQKTKLDANEEIIFPYKKNLYRKPASVQVFNTWLRIAAILIIIFTAALLMWLQSGKPVVNTAVAHHNTTPVKNSNPEGIIHKNSLPVEKTSTQDIALQKPVTKSKKPSIAIAKTNFSKKHATVKEVIQNHSSQQEIAIADKNKKPVERAAINKETVSIPPKQNSNNLPVTSVVPATYTNTEAPVTTMVNTVALTDDNDGVHKTPLKGFLRKATRFIERRTNIKPTNDDDELLIGAVSLKLK